MKTGKPPAWTLGSSDKIDFDVREVDEQRRLVVPARFLNRLPWFDQKNGAQCRAHCEEKGRVRIIGSETEIATIDSTFTTLGELDLGLADNRARIKRHKLLNFGVSINDEGRLFLPKPVAVHLWNSIQPLGPLYVIIELNRIELWSVDFYRTWLAEMSELDEEY